MTSPKSSSSCRMSAQDLQQAFDGESGAQDVARHVATCAPCNSALELLQTQRDAVQYLSDPAGDQPPQSAVEHILARTAHAGREKLADLLYEMAKACLIVQEDWKRRVNRWVEPREAPVVVNELTAINSRLDDADASVSLDQVPKSAPTETRALTAARSCFSILENVEGRTVRQRIGVAHLLIGEGAARDAEAVLRDLLAQDLPLDVRASVERNTMLTLTTQKKYSDAIGFGGGVLQHRADDAVILYNMAVSHAALHDRVQFEEYSSRVAGVITASEHEWLVRLIRFELANFASVLDSTVEEVEMSFGLSPRGVEAT